MVNSFVEFWPLWSLISLTIIINILKPLIKGKLGEIAVALFLKFLNNKHYRVMHNVTLYHEGYKSQIDHIIVSNFGVFVVETKNYKGWIMGSDGARYWTQVIYKSRKKLYNPILQNQGHVRTLKNILSNYPNIKYIPIVVFTWKSKLKINTRSDVINIFSLLKTIKRFKQANLNDLQKDEIFYLLKSKNRRKPKKQNQKYNFSTNSLNHMPYAETCPYCFNMLTLKNGKYGKFKACSGYPRCRYIQPIF